MTSNPQCKKEVYEQIQAIERELFQIRMMAINLDNKLQGMLIDYRKEILNDI